MTTTPPNAKLTIRDEGGSPGSSGRNGSRHAKKARRHCNAVEEQADPWLPGTEAKDSAGSTSPKDGSSMEDPGESSATSPKESGPEEAKMDDKFTFPERLMHLLENKTEPEALWWQKDDVSFGFEPEMFTERVLNKLFPSKIKFESFIRKLNRWGFRRVPGQGLPPHGAAYKHPLFKKNEPELMRRMKFGQKGDNISKTNSFVGLDSASAALARAVQLPAGFEQSLVSHSLMSNQAQILQNMQQQAFLQSMANSQHRHVPVAAEYLGQQQFATDALSTSIETETQLRNRLLLGSIPGSLTFLQLQSAMPQFLQSESSITRQQAAQIPGTALDGALSDKDLRNMLLFGSTISGSGADSQQSFSHSAASIAPSRTGGGGGISLGGSSLSQFDLSSRLLPGTGFSSSQTQSQDQASHTGQLSPGILDQLALLRQQQPRRSRDQTADLLYLYLLEQQRNQNSQGN